MLSLLIHTLGCKLNQLESEAITDAFMQAGFDLYDPSTLTDPSIILINTCTVTSKADQKARRVIRKALRDYPDSSVIVTGCYAQLDQEEIKKLGEGFDDRLIVVKGMDKNSLLNFLPRTTLTNTNEEEEIINELPELVPSGTFTNEDKQIEEKVRFHTEGMIRDRTAGTLRGKNSSFQFAPERFSAHTRSFFKIQDGCDKHCTYCRIRLARGPSVSLDADQALERLRILEETHAEAVLTGVNICQYRSAGADSLAALLERLLAGTAKISLRLSSLAPDSIDENLAEVLSNKRIRPHFHLSVQSGSQKILKKMGRDYTPETVEKAAAALRKAKDDPFLACDIIAGFPGETEAEFEETRELCRKIDFAWIHAFPYSKRPGTPAYNFPNPVQDKEITKRVQILTNLAVRGKADYASRWLDREVEVLIEKGDKKDCHGVSENYLKLLVQYKREIPLPGAVLRCRLGPKNNSKNDYDAVAYADK